MYRFLFEETILAWKIFAGADNMHMMKDRHQPAQIE